MEFGGTELSLGYAIEYMTGIGNMNFGLNYLAGFCSVYPNVGGLLGNIVNYYGFTNSLPLSARIHNLGGSILGEAYANFGFCAGLIFICLVGVFVNYIHQKFYKACKTKNAYDIAVLMMLLPNLLLWTRDYFYCMVYQFFWMSILIKLFCKRETKQTYFRG